MDPQNDPKPEQQPPTTLASVVQTLGPTTWLAIAAFVLPAIGLMVIIRWANPIGHWLRDHGAAGSALYIGGCAVLTGFALASTQAAAGLAGWAFGFVNGTIFMLAGLTVSCMIGYAIGRFGATSRVERLLDQHPRWRQVRNALIGGSFAKTLLIILLLRIPSTPYSATSLLLGSTRANLWAYFIGTVVGMAPRMAAFIYLADDLSKRLDPDKAMEVSLPWWAWAAGVAGAVASILVLNAIAKRTLHHITKDHSAA